MNREIKFQVWSRGELFGYERLTESGWEWMCIPLNPEGGERWCHGIMGTSDSYKRRMFTGLHDKKGVEIYEGDIVKDKFNIYVIKWSVGGLIMKQQGNREEKKSKHRCYNLSTGVEVIGNIYQNPELLNTTP